MPRKSAASLSVVAILPGQAPKPPSILTREQSRLWESIVATKPYDWFQADNLPLLVAYVRHITTANDLTARLEPGDLDLTEIAIVLKLRTAETASSVRLAMAMRLTQQSRYRADAAASVVDRVKTTGSSKPWEDIPAIM